MLRSFISRARGCVSLHVRKLDFFRRRARVYDHFSFFTFNREARRVYRKLYISLRALRKSRAPERDSCLCGRMATPARLISFRLVNFGPVRTRVLKTFTRSRSRGGEFFLVSRSRGSRFITRRHIHIYRFDAVICAHKKSHLIDCKYMALRCRTANINNVLFTKFYFFFLAFLFAATLYVA